MVEVARRTGRLEGAMTALVTPFRGEEVDFESLEGLVREQLEAGIGWLVPCGTTGESPTLSESEHDEIVARVVGFCGGRARVMAGTGSNCTATCVARTRRAAEAGAHAALLVVPYYNRPHAEGLFRHFATVAEAVELPLVLYNVPFRTGVHLSNDVVVRLAEAYAGRIVGLKHATGSVDGVTDLLGRCEIDVLSGDDVLTWPLMALGARGVISVVSNVAPRLVHSLVTFALADDVRQARRLHRQVYDLAEGLGRYGPNPVPIKTALAISGRIEESFRLPLCPLGPEPRAAIEQLLRRHELLARAPAAGTS